MARRAFVGHDLVQISRADPTSVRIRGEDDLPRLDRTAACFDEAAAVRLIYARYWSTRLEIDQLRPHQLG